MRKQDHFISKTLKHLMFVVSFLMISSVALSQVTTAGMNGRVISSTGESLPGATVVAVHQPSGTQYGTTTDMEGFYRIPNMRIGGPYTITVSYVGYKTTSTTDVTLALGQTFGYNANLTEESATITGVEVVSSRSDQFDGNRTGASTSLSNATITAMPTISRSINDFTKLSPQAGVGSSFGGRDSRYNNITIDGASFNNNFGLSGNNLPGGDAQPISLDAIEEISVNIAPFDIRQSNFTGANVNAVTRSGDNKYKGSAYFLFRDKSFNGKKVGDETLDLSNSTTQTYGARIGGPIIKDKLFFFANAEKEKSSYPGIAWRPSNAAAGILPDAKNYISRADVDSLSKMRQHLISEYGYDPGNYQDFGNFESSNYKLLGRLDWNINRNNKFTVRYNYVESTNDQEVNATSAPGTRSAFGRTGEKSLAFENSNYGFLNTVSSFSGELNTLFGNKAANKFLVTYTKIRDTRNSNSDIFPHVDIYKDGDPYMTFGYELFTFENDVKNNVLTITDNFNYFLGKHTITAGFSYDYLYFGNSYKRYGTSYYRYASMNDFITGKLPTTFGLTYPYDGAGDGYAELNFGYGSAYLQDEFQVNDKLRLTGGIRLEMPFYLDDLIQNPAVSENLTFKDENGQDEKLDIGSWPDKKLLFSPRLGFNYDVMGNRTIQLRGGTGIFTGRLPFVWFTNQPTNSGVLQNTVEITKTADIANYGLYFNADPMAYKEKFGLTPGDKAPGSIAMVDKDFKMPQVWRTNLAADIKLPWYNMILTLEGLYSKDINALVQRNANQATTDTTFLGPDQRIRFLKDKARVNPSISNAMVLYNTDGGYSTQLTVMLSRPFTNGLYGSLAYTYSVTKDYTANPGSAANSAWGSNPNVNGQNSLELANSSFTVPHRVVGAISYTREYLNHLSTTISVMYTGSNQGRMSYIYSNDMNGDGNTADLMYIPKDDSEITFVDIIDSKTKEVINTADQQRAAFWAFVDQDEYLSENKGSYAERFGALMPWRNKFDVRILQDIYTDFGSNRKHTLQISLDIVNVGNMINKDWGALRRQALGSYDYTLLRNAGVTSAGVPTFTLNKSGSSFPTNSYNPVLSVMSTWGAQIGLRYTF